MRDLENCRQINKINLEVAELSIAAFFKFNNLEEPGDYNFESFLKFLNESFCLIGSHYYLGDPGEQNIYYMEAIINLFFIGSPYEGKYLIFEREQQK